MARNFTLEEAAALLPRLRDLLSEMQQTKVELDALRRELGEMTRVASGNGRLLEPEVQRKRSQAQDLAKRLNELLRQINGLGCELKGLDEGLIDFPTKREDRTVYLCWKLGEEQIAYWHELDAGFSTREPL